MSKRQTIPLSLRSSLITTMFTPWGRYRWTRLPLVISSASKERQRQIHMVLDGLLSLGITHGILIPGCGANDMEARIDHDRSLTAVLEGFDWRWMSTGWNSLFAKPPSWAMLPLRMASSPTLSHLKLWSLCPLQQKSKKCDLELPSYKPSNHTVAAPLTSLLYDPLRTAKGLITTEECYAQIEKECLAIVEALNTFEEFLLRKSNKVYTDQQPIQSIFKKDLATAPKCLQKMFLFLQRYNFTIMYRKGSLLNLADNLSRNPCQDEAVFHFHLARLDPNPLALANTTREQLRNATSSCPDIHLLQHYSLNGWPSAKLLPHQLQASWHFHEELSIANGTLKSTYAIVPTLSDQACWAKSSTRFALDAIFWPNMSENIEAYFQSCPTCSQWGKQAASDYTIPSCPYTTLAVHLARHIWVPT